MFYAEKIPVWLLGFIVGLSFFSTGETEVRVVCYYTNWSVYRPGTAKFSPQNINPYLCTHLIYAFGGFTKENTLKPFDKYQDIEKGGYAKFTGLKTYNKNLKTMLAIGGWNEGSARFSSLVASAERRKEFVKNTIKFLRLNHFDGLDLDWEYPSFRDGGRPADRENYAQLVQELREEFEREHEKTNRPRLLLTMAVPAGIEYVKKGYDVEKLNKYLDWMNILSYDYHSAFEPSVNHHAPLYPIEEENEYNFDVELNIDHTIKYYLEAGADRDKLVLGIPTYGRTYTLFNPDATEIGSPADGPGEMGEATKEKGYLAYYEICENLKGSDDWTVVQPNPRALGPYAYKENQWVGYDDEDIVKKKSKYVAEQGLGGIMFWSIDNDDFRGKCHGRPYPLIEAAKEALIANSRQSNTIQSSRTKSRTRGGSSNNIIRSNSGGRQSISTDDENSERYKARVSSRFNVKQENKVDETESEVTSTRRRVNNRGNSNSSRRRVNANRRSTTTTTTTTAAPVYTTTPKYFTPEPPTTPDPGSDFKCEDEGFFPHPRDCKKYFWCLSSGPSDLGIVAHQFTCPAGLYFNKAADSCDYSRNVLCKKKSTTTETTSSKSNVETSTTTVAPSTTRVPPKITAATSKTSFRYTTSTTPIPEYEYEYEYEDEEEPAGSLDSEEDPRVIKDLIELIKKAGGIEELEKQLRLQNDGTATIQSGPNTTPATISKSLYQRVLNARNSNKSLTQTIQNSRTGPQGGRTSESTNDFSRKEKPQYTTINRQRTSTKVEEPEEKEEIQINAPNEYGDQNNFFRAKAVITAQKPEYVVIERIKPVTEVVDENDEFIPSRGPSFQETSFDTGKKNYERNYVSLNRQRPATEETTSLKYQTIQRTRSSPAPVEIETHSVLFTPDVTTFNDNDEFLTVTSPLTTQLFDSNGHKTTSIVYASPVTETVSKNVMEESNTELTDALLNPLLNIPAVTEITEQSSTTSDSQNENTSMKTDVTKFVLPEKTTPSLQQARPFSKRPTTTTTVKPTEVTTAKVSSQQPSSDTYSATRRRPLTPHGFLVGSTNSDNTPQVELSFNNEIRDQTSGNAFARTRNNKNGEGRRPTDIRITETRGRFISNRQESPKQQESETPRNTVNRGRSGSRFRLSESESDRNVVRNFRPTQTLNDLSSLTSVDTNRPRGRRPGSRRERPTTPERNILEQSTEAIINTRPTRRGRPSSFTTEKVLVEPSTESTRSNRPSYKRERPSTFNDQYLIETTPTEPSTRYTARPYTGRRRIVPNRQTTPADTDTSEQVGIKNYRYIPQGKRILASTLYPTDSSSYSTEDPEIHTDFSYTSTKYSYFDSRRQSNNFDEQRFSTYAANDLPSNIPKSRNRGRFRFTEDESTPILEQLSSVESTSPLSVTPEEFVSSKLVRYDNKENVSPTTESLTTSSESILLRRRKVIRKLKPIAPNLNIVTGSIDLTQDNVDTKVTTNQTYVTEPNIIIRTRKVIRKLRPITTTESNFLKAEEPNVPNTKVSLDVQNVEIEARTNETQSVNEEEVKENEDGGENITTEPEVNTETDDRATKTTKASFATRNQNRVPYKPRRVTRPLPVTTEESVTPERGYRRRPTSRPELTRSTVSRIPFRLRKPPTSATFNESEVVETDTEPENEEVVLDEIDSDLESDKKTTQSPINKTLKILKQNPRFKSYPRILGANRLTTLSALSTSKQRKMNRPVDFSKTSTESLTTYDDSHTTDNIRHIFSEVDDIDNTATEPSTGLRVTNGIVGRTKHYKAPVIAETTAFPVYLKNDSDYIEAQKKLEKILEVNRVSEISLKAEREKNHTRQPEPDVTLNTIPQVDKIGEINRVTIIKIVDGNFNETSNEIIINKNAIESLATSETSGFKDKKDSTNGTNTTTTATSPGPYIPTVTTYYASDKEGRKISIDSHSRVANSFTPKPDFTEVTTLAIEALFKNMTNSTNANETSLPTLKEVLHSKPEDPFKDIKLDVRILKQDTNEARALNPLAESPILPIRVLQQESSNTVGYEEEDEASLRVIPLTKTKPIPFKTQTEKSELETHEEVSVKYGEMGGFINSASTNRNEETIGTTTEKSIQVSPLLRKPFLRRPLKSTTSTPRTTTVAPITSSTAKFQRRKYPTRSTTSSSVSTTEAQKDVTPTISRFRFATRRPTTVKPITKPTTSVQIVRDQSIESTNQEVKSEENTTTEWKDLALALQDVQAAPIPDKKHKPSIQNIDITTERLVAIRPRKTTTHPPILTTPPPVSRSPARHRPRIETFEKLPLKTESYSYKPLAEDYDYYDEDVRIIVKENVKGKVLIHPSGRIQCLDQGNFPHPISCKKFISCAKMESGAVIGWEYTCPKNLSFDPVGGMCNWAAGLGCNN